MHDWFYQTKSEHTVQKSHCPPGNNHASHLYNDLFPGPNDLLTTGADDPSL